VESRSAEMAAEQDYFDAAAAHRARSLKALGNAQSAAAHPGVAAHLKRHAEAAADAINRADQGVAFGRIDTEDAGTLYIGRQWISDEMREPVVINWHVPAAAPYFEASHAKPLSVTRKRTYECDGNTIRDFADVVFADIAATVDTFLLRELGRARTGAMRDIVATIQAAQYDVIRAPMEQVLIIEGGPGTGKTAVALHRVSWLLFHHSDTVQADGVLVVGPHPTFIRYLREVLPSLGDSDVVMRDITQLAPDVPRGRSEPAPVARLKGDARMASMLARALESRIGTPESAERIPVGGRFVSVPGADIQALLAECRAAAGPYLQRRAVFRERLADLVRTRAGAEPDRQGALANLVERLWPQQSAASFLGDLFGSRRRLLAARTDLAGSSGAPGGAAGGEGADEGTATDGLTEDEARLLYRRGADRLSQEIWSPADLPLLDELEHLINGGTINGVTTNGVTSGGLTERYAHIVIDEAQDLSPMQLRSVARRSGTGSITVVGDLAQSTGPWARDGWEEVTSHLPTTFPVSTSRLRYGYRVPRQAYEHAARLLPVAAPAVSPPDVIRDGPAEPRVHQVHLDQRAGQVVAVAQAHAVEGRFVGIICPQRCRREVEAALSANSVEWSSADRGELGATINLVSPQEAKGLEFDAVVVVEPEQIVADYERGHRMLYIALTRTTGYVDVVCVGDPLPLTVPPPPLISKQDDAPAFDARDVRRLAEHIANQVSNAAPQPFWNNVMAEAARLLAETEQG
jgi:hypothetical protein